ncbi:hypothetical protein HMPREF0202_02754 [Cetobacterium somerae ATCC BAA-474]|uniref:Mga helix-turn-helix domain-containing protein n=1 Tax=Cetobacterium somerae ATCC BAA-474 TaxID=1319815 RepID=U7V3N0_9FUSO|nr:hypothetical protein [Cetobacterium somerae]ERT65759.1 hypothetical protein HMPREF0202_02754 [Cetobacterium somerae ATCC BAA-474]
MNTTAANILKVLSQTEMSIEDMQLYFNVEKSSIIKTISQLNEFLISINLPIISKDDNFYFLKLNSEELKVLFENFTILTTDEKIDYLFIKFISNGFLNLEREKEILDISRSTILRCFQVVKDEFLKNGTTYEYCHGKGLILKNLSKNDKNLFYKKLMKFFIEEDILVPVRKNLLDSIKLFDTKKRLSQLYPILKNSDISINYFLLSFICSLEVCIHIFGGFNFIDDSNLELDKFKELQKNINIFGSDFDEEFKNQLCHFLTSLSCEKGILEASIIDICRNLTNSIKNKFRVKISNKDLEKMLFNKLYLSFFKYNNKIVKIINVSFSKPHKIILNKLDEILNEFSYTLYLVDKFMIVYVIRRILIDENFSNIKSVLLLFNEVVAVDQIVFKKSLKKYHPNITFDVEATFFHKKDIIQNHKNYDIIISDSNIVPNVKVVEYYNTINIHSILENHALTSGLNKLNTI